MVDLLHNDKIFSLFIQINFLGKNGGSDHGHFSFVIMLTSAII